MINFSTVMTTLAKNKSRRAYPSQTDPRCKGEFLFPEIHPKFSLEIGDGASVFTIGSCFARNIEEALTPLGVYLPTREFAAPIEEFAGRPNALLNEYNPGSMSRRVLDALDGVESPEETLVAVGDKCSDLLLPGSANVAPERARQRRREIFEVYAKLKSCEVVVITLGLVEAWYDRKSGYYLNRMPPQIAAKAEPERYVLARLDVEDAMPLLDKAVGRLGDEGKKVLLTVSPVPLITTLIDEDAVIANEFSKSVLRVCAEKLRRRHAHLDYFPSYEIVRSAGLAGYGADNVHVKNELVRTITKHMVAQYKTPSDARASAPAPGFSEAAKLAD